ncbi:helix-turn-helix transcriptional regulator [Methanolobus halotolerans]|nr:transcriptional regulator FilR1 domain-containing protein [Methanolobus halotolerans]
MDEGPKDFDTLCIASGMAIKEFLSNIEILEEHYLVTGEKGVYSLTCMGKLIIEKLKPFLSIEEFMNTTEGYWQNRNLDFIPPPLLKRLHEVHPCTVVQPGLAEIFDYNKEAHEKSRSSKSFNMIASGIHPDFPDLFKDMIERGVNLSLTFDPHLFDKIKRDNNDELHELMHNERVELYMYPEKMHFLSLKVNEYCIVLKLLTNEGIYDHKQLMCHGPKAVAWGKQLFEYYQKDSIPITEI